MAESLLAEKPNSIHCINSRKLGITRDQAKAISYGCLIQSRTEVLTPDGYKPCMSIKVGDPVVAFYTTFGLCVVDEVLYVHTYEAAEVVEMVLPTGQSIIATENHRWLGKDAEGSWSYAQTDDLGSLHKVFIGEEFYDPSQIIIKPHPNEDVFCITTKTGNWYTRTNGVETVTGNCLYGAQPPKLQSMLGLTPQAAEKMYNDYWDAVPSLKFLKASLEKFWLASDKKHVAALDGRILTARSKHSLLNVLLQSGGSLVMKYAVLRLTQLLEERGLLGNVLEDSELEGRDKAYQCIVYHDEVQIAIPKEWYNPQKFSTEEEAKAFRAEHHLSTPIHEEAGKWCIDGPNVMTELVDKAILETKEHLKLRVDIGIEHSSGDTWADTH